MENIYFFWWIKYMLNSSEERDKIIDSIPDTIKNLIREVPLFDSTDNKLREVKYLFNLMSINLEDYATTGNDDYLKVIRRINRQIAPILNEIYKELAFFDSFIPVREEIFLEREAIKRSGDSSLLVGLEHLINGRSDGNLSEEEAWEWLDRLRDVIYDIQEGELAKLSEGTENPDEENSLTDFSDLFESGLGYLEESLEIIERAFENKNMEEAGKGLVKTRKGLINIKIVEMITESGGVVR